MATPDDLTLFVREALAAGRSRDEIAAVLREAGWADEPVAAALGVYAEVDFPVPVPRPRAELTARDAFRFGVLFTALYLSVWHVGNLLFQLINRAFPDPAWISYGGGVSAASVRLSVAVLVVAFPLFAWMTRLVERETAPAQRRSPARRVLTYLTLFVAVCVLLGTGSALVYSLLSGELTVRFILKSLVVAGLAAAVFGVYLGDVREGAPERSASRHRFVLAATGVVLLAVAGGLWAVGGPGSARADRLDEMRLQHLAALEGLVRGYHRENGALPPSLDAIDDLRLAGYDRADPETGEPYRYEVRSDSAFSLCATFSRSRTAEEARPWGHRAFEAGDYCFEHEVVGQR